VLRKSDTVVKGETAGEGRTGHESSRYEGWAGDGQDDDGDESQEVTLLEEVATFDGIDVWSHEAVPDGTQDRYVRGVEEWMGLAMAVSFTR
jgi:hypothetical protein